MAQKKKKGGFLSGITSAVDDIAGSIDRATKSVTTDLTNTINPLTYFVAGNVVMITSRTSLKCLSVDNNGAVSCNVPPLKISTATAHFQIVPSIYSPTAYKLRNMAYPNFYLAIFNGNLIGNGLGGPECDFYPKVAQAVSTVDISEFMSLQSAMFPGSYLGILKTGQVTVPAQTSPTASHTAHFKLKYIKQAALPPQKPPPAQQPPPPQQLPPPGQSPGQPLSTPPMQRQGPPGPGQEEQQYPLPSAPPPYGTSGYYPPQQSSPGMAKRPL